MHTKEKKKLYINLRYDFATIKSFANLKVKKIMIPFLH